MQKTIQIQDMSDRDAFTTWRLPQDAIARYGQGILCDLAVSADGTSLAVGSAAGVWWYDLTTRLPVTFFETERGMIDCVSLCLDQPWLALKNSDKDGNEVIKIWDMQRHKCISVMEYPARFRDYPSRVFLGAPCFSPSGEWLAASHDGNVAAMHDGSVIVDVWESLTGRVRTSLKLPSEDIELCSIDDGPDNGFFWNFSGALAFSTDDRFVASSHWSDFISVWDITHGERVIRLTGHAEGVHSLSFSPCGQFLAAGGIKGTVQVWDTSTWQLHRTYPSFGDDWMDISYAPDGSLRAAGISHDQCTITVWDVARKPKVLYTFHEKNYCKAEISPIHFSNGTHLAFQSDSEVQVKTVGKTNPLAVLPGEHGDLHSLVFSPDGKTLCAGYRQFRGVVLWDVTTHRPQRVVTEPRCHIVAVYSNTATGKFYATGYPPGESLYYGNTLNLWEIGQSEPIAELTVPGEPPDTRDGMAYAPATNLLACGNGTEKDSEIWDENDPENGAVYVWDVARGQMRHIFRGKHTNRIDYMRFSPDGTRLLSIDVDATKRVWDVMCGKEIGEFEDKELTHLFPIFYYPPLIELDGEDPNIEPRENSPCGQYVAYGEGWQPGLEKVPVQLWDIHTGKRIATFLGHPTDIQCLAFSPDSTILASGGFDGVILLWDLTPYL